MNRTIQTRFKDATWMNMMSSISNIIVGGCGGIGSWVTFFLAKLTENITVYDDDYVELHNLGGQFFAINDVGNSKVSAIYNKCMGHSAAEIRTCHELYTNSTSEVMIACFDNMLARKEMFQAWKSDNKAKIFIDGRLLAEEFQIFCLTKESTSAIEHYEKTYLFSDKEVPAVSCSLKQTTHIAAMIASQIVMLLTNYLDKERPLPFLTLFNAESCFFKYEYLPNNQ